MIQTDANEIETYECRHSKPWIGKNTCRLDPTRTRESNLILDLVGSFNRIELDPWSGDNKSYVLDPHPCSCSRGRGNYCTASAPIASTNNGARDLICVRRLGIKPSLKSQPLFSFLPHSTWNLGVSLKGGDTTNFTKLSTDFNPNPHYCEWIKIEINERQQSL